MLTEELRIKDARMARLAPARRPHYVPPDRLAILELRAARGWSAVVTAKRFLLTDATIAGWTGRCQTEGPDELVRPQLPVNRYPDFVAHLLHELRATLPSMGRRRIADMLARAGLHLGKTTVQRLLRKPAPAEPSPLPPPEQKAPSGRTVIARYPEHVWSADLTVVPTPSFWVPWFPFALPQRWPFCWWILAVVDDFSRAVVHLAVFRAEPTSTQLCRELDRAIANATGPPKYFVTPPPSSTASSTAPRSSRSNARATGSRRPRSAAPPRPRPARSARGVQPESFTKSLRRISAGSRSR